MNGVNSVQMNTTEISVYFDTGSKIGNIIEVYNAIDERPVYCYSNHNTAMELRIPMITNNS